MSGDYTKNTQVECHQHRYDNQYYDVSKLNTVVRDKGRTEPCGTPHIMLARSDIILSIRTCCFRSLRYDTMRFKASSHIPTCFPSTVNKLL